MPMEFVVEAREKGRMTLEDLKTLFLKYATPEATA